MTTLAKVIDMREWKIRAALKELEQSRATAEAAQAILAEAAAESDHITHEFGMCPCSYCVRFAADLPCSNYPACTCCGRPVQPRKVRKAVQHHKRKRRPVAGRTPQRSK